MEILELGTTKRWLLDMIIAGEPVELDTRDLALAELPQMALWVSPGLNVILAKAEGSGLGVELHRYRRLDAVWLTWLRLYATRGKSPESVSLFGQRAAELGKLVAVFMPELAGAVAEIPEGYEPPALDSVSYARS